MSRLTNYIASLILCGSFVQAEQFIPNKPLAKPVLTQEQYRQAMNGPIAQPPRPTEVIIKKPAPLTPEQYRKVMNGPIAVPPKTDADVRRLMGEKPVIKPSVTHVLRQPPTISANTIDVILEMNNSPAKGIGEFLCEVAEKNGLDNAYLLAIFGNESRYGNVGRAVKTKSWSNARPGSDWKGAVYKSYSRGKFRQYKSYKEGLVDLCKILNEKYATRNTPEEISAKYAPPTENNTARYVAEIKRRINTYRKIESGEFVAVKSDGKYVLMSKENYARFKLKQSYQAEPEDLITMLEKSDSIASN